MLSPTGSNRTRRGNPKGAIMGIYRIFPGETVIVVPEIRCATTLRSGRCDGNDVVVPALWHNGTTYSGVVVDVHGFDTVVVEHDGQRDFVPYDRCVQR